MILLKDIERNYSIVIGKSPCKFQVLHADTVYNQRTGHFDVYVPQFPQCSLTAY